MRVYIHTDIEGIAGWAFYANADLGSIANYHHTQRMNQLLTNEVVTACRAAFDAGADEVWVNDAHSYCYSVLFEQLPKRCQIIHGRPGHFDAWLGHFKTAPIDALVCVGQHAMAGTPYSVCPHSLWHLVADGKPMKLSETTMAAALAGSRGVPCVCVTGDDKICAEVAEKIPGVEPVIVKWAISAQNARSLTPADACDRIYEGVLAGLGRREQIAPFALPSPYSINISDRDPTQRILPHDVQGDDFWETVHRALNSTTYAHFGADPIDDRSFRWPA